MVFPKSFLFGANVPFGNQNVHPTSQLWIYCKMVLQFCTMKEAKRDMGIILMVFWKEVLFRAIWLFGNKNSMTSSYLWVCSQVFLLILHNKRDHEVHENFTILFLRKNPIWINLIFLCHF